MSKALALDTESNTWNKGAPFDGRHKAVCYSWAVEGDAGASPFESDSIERLRSAIAGTGVVVGFNLKYDIHVLRKQGIELPEGCRIWDCQLAEFILSNQQWKYPSLNEACAKYGLGSKVDVIAENYWNNGIQTEDIPWNELSEYATQDAILTLALYQKQDSIMTPSQKRLCRLMNLDLMILEEMEWNGIRFNEELCAQRSSEIKIKISEITRELSAVYPNVSINFGSGDQLSAFLYGGTIVEDGKEHIGFYKSGLKAGQPKFRNVEILHELPRLVEPLRGSELKKQGFYATNADTLLKLKANKATRHILDLVQQQTRLETLLSKTYEGLQRKRIEQNWEPGWLHGQFNQVTVATGRLSSSGPNLQNLDSAANDLFISRYNT
jgi:DNA polymerase I-like protein with 3'-5' exonuclease and polymerase domains